ncbi:MAG: hypothetical protein ACI865_000918 [Flavobacteriaceae bacterium]|jgi:hypothetical protein
MSQLNVEFIVRDIRANHSCFGTYPRTMFKTSSKTI